MCKLKTCENQKLDEEEPALDVDYSDESDDEDDDTEWDIGSAFVFKGHTPSIAYWNTHKIWIYGHLLSH